MAFNPFNRNLAIVPKLSWSQQAPGSMEPQVELARVVSFKTSSPLTGEDRGEGDRWLMHPSPWTLSRKGRGKTRHRSADRSKGKSIKMETI